MKKLSVVASVLVLLLATALPAGAITYGQPDAGEHPYVGVVVFYSPIFEDYVACSGTLIAPSIFLTAGHCAADATTAWVDFRESPPYDFHLFEKTGHGVAHPQFDISALPNSHDIGVIVLDSPKEMPTYGQLAALGYLNSYAKRVGRQPVTFEPVGYGINSYKPKFEWWQSRYKAEQRIINLKSALTDGYNVMLTNDPGKGTGRGGTCQGDSGGPVLVNNTNLIVAVTSFSMTAWCTGNDYAYRTDILSSYEFLDTYVDVLP